MAYGLRTSLLSLLVAGLLAWTLPRHILRNIILRVQSFYRLLITQATQRRKTIWILIWLVALIPMLHLTCLVRHYGIEAPTFDDWEMAPLIVKAQTHQLKFADLFQQQQEGRTILPKLIFILSAVGGRWDVRDQMMLSVISCWLTAAGIFLLLRQSGLHVAAVAVCFWLAVLAVFSPAQFELWLFASGFPSFLPALFIVTTLVVNTTKLPTHWKFMVCAILAVACSFTLPHGLLAWALTFPILLIVQRVRAWPYWLGLWLAAAALCATLYFWGYQKPGYLPQFAPHISLLEYVRFILIFLGGGLAYSLNHRAAIAAPIFGTLTLALFLIALGYSARRIRDRLYVAKVAPWFALALYSLGSACLAALGRIGFGATYALASRYVTFSLYLTVAVIALVAIISSEILNTASSRRSRGLLVGFWLILVLVYLIPYKAAAGNTLYFLRGYSANDRLAHGAILFSAALDTSSVITKIAYPPGAAPVVQGAAALDRLHLLQPPLVRTTHISALPHEEADTASSGACETITTLSDGLRRASGWAVLKTKRRQADCIVLAYETPGQEWIAFAISDAVEPRPDLAKRFRNDDALWTGWTATFSPSALSADARLSFWAVDADEPKLYRLSDNSKAP